MSASPIGGPATPIIFPAGFTSAERDALKTSNPGAVFLILGTAPTQTTALAPDHHRDVVTGWCDTIDNIVTYAGGAAASLIVSPALAPLVVSILKWGTSGIRALLLKDPAVERWTLEKLQAEPLAARPLP